IKSTNLQTSKTLIFRRKHKKQRRVLCALKERNVVVVLVLKDLKVSPGYKVLKDFKDLKVYKVMQVLKVLKEFQVLKEHKDLKGFQDKIVIAHMKSCHLPMSMLQ